MQKKKFFNLVSILIGILFLSACEYATITPDGPAPGQKVSFQTDIIPIFNSGCNNAGCHNSTGPKPDLTPTNAYQSLVENNMVVAGKGSESLLYTALQQGGVMAAYGSAKNNALIKNWIDQGAENN